MDITGYGRRDSPLLRASYDPKRKPPKHGTTSLATRAILLLLFLLALWSAVHRLRCSPAPAAPAGKAGGASGAAAGGSDPAAAAAAADAAREARNEALAAARAERAMRIVPQYRGPGKVETFPHFSNANRLLLASHGRLMWYRYDTDQVTLLHEGQGVYYGAFPGAERGVLGEPTTLWVVSRPHNWHDAADPREWLLHLHMESGRELRRVQIPSRWAHDAVRRRDRVYVASTGDGRVLELAFANMTLVRELPLFTLHEHVNTLAPTADGHLWALLHNLGNSSLAQVDLSSGREVSRVAGVGLKAHGLVFWGQHLLALDSDQAALALVDPRRGNITRLWHLGEPSRFLKGLAVVDDIAFFGVAPRSPRGGRDDPGMACELAAFDLREGLLLWRRQMPTRGLLNIVAAPHLAVESTTYALSTADLLGYRGKRAYGEALAAAHTWQLQQEREAQAAQAALARGGGTADGGGEGGAAAGGQRQAEELRGGDEEQRMGQAGGAGAVRQAGRGAGMHEAQQQQQQEQQEEGAAGEGLGQQEERQQEEQQAGGEGALRRGLIELDPADPLAQYPPVLDDVSWSSGLPRLSLGAKQLSLGLAGGVQLPLLQLDVSGLKAQLAAMPQEDWEEAAQRASNAWVEGRDGVLDRFKPGARAIMLLFSDQDGATVFRFPWYARFARWVEPWMVQILGRADLNKVMRLQLALMPPHSEIKRHTDSGGYATRGHRIHVVVRSNAGVSFEACDPPPVDEHGVAAAADSACVPCHVEEGLVFELNNRLGHRVKNGGDEPRVHLIMDVAHTPRRQHALRAGQVCSYRRGRITCTEQAEPRAEQQAEEGHGGGDVLRRR